MRIVQDSPEHHFLTFLERMKKGADGWYGIHLAMSRKISHESLISDLRQLPQKLEAAHHESLAFLEILKEQAGGFDNCTTYLFSDSDIVMLFEIETVDQQDATVELFEKLKGMIGEKICEYSNIAKNLYNYQKLSDQKFLSARRIEAYEALADSNRVSSIPVRRRRRPDGVVMVVEDDRFTANYAAGILNKEYEVVSAKTGEEAILMHIEHAPDMVFLDIHLPGLSGHETLQAIKQADPDAFIVMLSVDTVKSNIVSASQRGAAGFLKKPFSKDRLLHAVNQSPFIRQIKSGVGKNKS